MKKSKLLSLGLLTLFKACMAPKTKSCARHGLGFVRRMKRNVLYLGVLFIWSFILQPLTAEAKNEQPNRNGDTVITTNDDKSQVWR